MLLNISEQCWVSVSLLKAVRTCSSTISTENETMKSTTGGCSVSGVSWSNVIGFVMVFTFVACWGSNTSRSRSTFAKRASLASSPRQQNVISVRVPPFERRSPTANDVRRRSSNPAPGVSLFESKHFRNCANCGGHTEYEPPSPPSRPGKANEHETLQTHPQPLPPGQYKHTEHGVVSYIAWYQRSFLVGGRIGYVSLVPKAFEARPPLECVSHLPCTACGHRSSYQNDEVQEEPVDAIHPRSHGWRSGWAQFPNEG